MPMWAGDKEAEMGGDAEGRGKRGGCLGKKGWRIDWPGVGPTGVDGKG